MNLFPKLLSAQGFLGLHWADWIVLAVYFVVIVGIGVWSAKKVHDMSDFFMGGRRFGKVFMMFFAFGAGTSSEQANGVVAGTWRAGLAGIWWQFLWLWATPFYWIVAPVMRRMRALTTSDFFEARYNTSTATLYCIYGIIMSIVFIAGGLFSSGKMVNALTGGELERVADQWDFRLPDIKYDTATGSFGRGRMFTLVEDGAAELDADQVSEALREEFKTSRKDLSQDASIVTVEAGSQWEIHDNPRDLSYHAVLEEIGGEWKIAVYGAGWRRLAGYELAILVMTVMFVIYGMAGGLGAAIITDFIQGILTITFSFLLLPFVFQAIGGFGELHEQEGIKNGMLNLVASEEVGKILGKDPITVFYVVMLSVTALAGIVVQPHIMGVCGAGKTELEGRFGFTYGNFMKRFCTMAWTFTGLACIVWYLGTTSPLRDSHEPRQPAKEQVYQDLVARGASDKWKHSVLDEYKQELSPEAYAGVEPNLSKKYQDLPREEQERLKKVDDAFADELFGRAAYDVLPTISVGLIGLLLASLLAAVMSTSDAQMVVSSGLFTENIYRKFLARKRSQRHYLWVGRISGLLIVVLALALQSTFENVIHALQVIIKTPAAIGISLWIGIVWRGWTPIAVWLSTFFSAAIWAFVAYWPKTIREWGVPDEMFNVKGELLDSWTMLAYLSVGIVSGFVVSFLTPRTKQAKLDNFFDLVHTPIKPGEKVDTPCTLPDDPLPKGKKLINHPDIELPRPTVLGIGGFLVAWALVGLIIWLTTYLARTL